MVGEAGDGDAAVAEAERSQPDVVVIDIALPKLNGIEATRRLKAKMPTTQVVALSMNWDRSYVMAMLEAGATGYLLKDAAAAELLTALGAVSRGETYLSPRRSRQLWLTMRCTAGRSPPPDRKSR